MKMMDKYRLSRTEYVYKAQGMRWRGRVGLRQLDCIKTNIKRAKLEHGLGYGSPIQNTGERGRRNGLVTLNQGHAKTREMHHNDRLLYYIISVVRAGV